MYSIPMLTDSNKKRTKKYMIFKHIVHDKKTGIQFDTRNNKRSIHMILIIIIALLILFYLDYQLGVYLTKKTNKSEQWLSYSDHISIYTDGTSLYEQLCKDIEHAKHSIDIQFYIIRQDKISNRLYALLSQKQDEGVEVRFLTDWVGSFFFRKKWLQDRFAFKKANRPKAPFFYHLQKRNHRKVVVIDKEIAYCGGFNLGDEYLGRDLHLGKWRDYHVRLTGDVAYLFHHVFTEDWNKSKVVIPSPTLEGDLIRIVRNEGGSLEESIVHLIRRATNQIEIGSPYFIPTKRVLTELFHALDRGVHVKIVIPEKADHLLTKAGALSFLTKMNNKGAQIFLYMDGFFHGKVLFIDDHFCDIGTSNFDQRSFRLNEELNMIVDNSHPIYQKMREVYDADLVQCKEMTEQWIRHQPLWMRLLGFISPLFRPFL